jgi:hypothetical protein
MMYDGRESNVWLSWFRERRLAVVAWQVASDIQMSTWARLQQHLDIKQYN